jgi:hypothetical protein
MFILLDAGRCPRQPSNVFGRHLGAFNEHPAKGIYAKCYDARLATFGETCGRLSNSQQPWPCLSFITSSVLAMSTGPSASQHITCHPSP